MAKYIIGWALVASAWFGFGFMVVTTIMTI